MQSFFAALLLTFLWVPCFAAGPAEATPLAGSPFGALLAREVGADAEQRSAPHRVALLSQGDDALLLRVHLIRSARTSIEVQTFIWSNDDCGRLLMFELIAAAQRGVKVRIIADHLFSEQDPDVVAYLATVSPNLEVKHYRPATSRMKPSLLRTLLAGLRSFRDVNQRMHNKVLLIDDAVLITGGRNIENAYFDRSTGLNFRDRDVVVTGPAVREASEQFEQFWKYRFSIRSSELSDVNTALKTGAYQRFTGPPPPESNPLFAPLNAAAGDARLIQTRFVDTLRPVAKARFVYDPPGKPLRNAKAATLTSNELKLAIEHASSHVVVQTPYLVLSPTARKLMRELRKHKPELRVQISTNSFASTDNLFAYSANYRLRNEYVEDLGLVIHEFKPRPGSLYTLFPGYKEMARLAEQEAGSQRTPAAPFLSLHAKSLVVDDRVAFVGSYNLDPRSAHLNTEVGLLVEDEAFARRLHAEIEEDMRPENSWMIARKRFPLGLEGVNAIIDGLLSLTPIDVWPIQNTSSFELLPGATPCDPNAPGFHDRYKEVGSFPGTDGLLTQKEIVTRLFKAVGAPLTPIL